MPPLRRLAAALIVAPVGAVLLAGCDDVNTIVRARTPVVLTGAELDGLLGVPVGEIVAFRHERPESGPAWVQIPVQIDERKVVDFGSQPGSNATPGVAGTVYGTAPIGVTAVQYADPGTFVGADDDPTLDADDEVVVLAGDAGGRPRDEERTEPLGVLAGSGIQVQLDDPLGDDDQAWVHLFRAAPASGLDPAAGRDDVDYDFELTSGPYLDTYKRANGPNPETSVVRTASYEARMSDRWIEDDWRVFEGSATGVDLLDGAKAQFAFGFCGRSNVTFADAEGAFVANIDGPLRAIRSYVGANSGPLTQRTHRYYADSLVVTTDLRVHAIPSVMDFLDLSAAATGMTYRNSVDQGGVVVDGEPDAVSSSPAEWELWTGGPGAVFSTSRLSLSGALGAADPASFLQQVYVDDATPAEQECWGDGGYHGAAGTLMKPAGGIPNTDPRAANHETFQVSRTVYLAWPGVDAARAQVFSERIDEPLAVTTSAYSLTP